MRIGVISYKLHVLEPIVDVLFRSSKFVSEAHANDIGGIFKSRGYLGQTGDPRGRVKESVAKETVAVVGATAPSWLGHVVV